MTKEIKLSLAGFGAVGQRFCRLLCEKEAELADVFGCRVKITGISTPSRGTLINHNGLDMDEVFAMEAATKKFDQNHSDYVTEDTMGMIRNCRADVLCELTTLSVFDGEPAASHITEAFHNDMHVITANKGPIAVHFRKLASLADRHEKHFLYETTVMDGTPVFNMAKNGLHGCQVLGLRGIFNGTTNFLLGEISQGVEFDEAVKEAQRRQIAEADPSMDVDGLDGAAKLCALANVLMGTEVRPVEVDVTSLRSVSAEDIKTAAQSGHKIKYICTAKKEEGKPILYSVQPERIEKEDPLYSVDGTSAAVTLYTDLAGEMTVIQTEPTLLQTAYGVYSDLLTLVNIL